MRRDQNGRIYRLTVGGLLLAIGIVIPRMFHLFATSEIGKVLLPMHISVFIAGIYLGAFYGALIGFATPLINSLFGLPIFPFNLIMAIELAAYGLFAGLFMYILQKIMVKRIRKTIRIYISLILSMVFGRIIYAIVLFIMLKVFVMDVPGPISVITSAITGVPGIIIQLILVPAIVSILNFSQERYLG
ncbi:MAG: ECF transporter S component [Bacillota bacterium]|jgi:hypothetical protein|nr:ECF transporter S component [Bacillota bacterium]